MTNDQAIKYIIDLLNIKVDSEYSIIEVGSFLGTVTDVSEFIQYIRDRINLFGHQYLTGFQKFIVLSSEFKKLEDERRIGDESKRIMSLAEKMANKVKELDTMVLNSKGIEYTWEGFKFINEEGFLESLFKEKEIMALSAIGSPLACIMLQRSVSGRDMLCERLEAIFVARIANQQNIQLEAPKRANGLVSGLANSLRV